MPPFSKPERDLLIETSSEPKGRKLKGKGEKQIARLLSLRGLVLINKSVTRMKITPAGHYALRFSVEG